MLDSRVSLENMLSFVTRFLFMRILIIIWFKNARFQSKLGKQRKFFDQIPFYLGIRLSLGRGRFLWKM